MPRVMGGLGAPKYTMSGLIGQTKESSYTRTLGGLVTSTTPGPKPKVSMTAAAVPKNTEFHIIGPASKTPTPGEHYGQVPYPGAFRSVLGSRM
jgi:hypothetical protein